MLGPASMDIRFAGRAPSAQPIHRAIAALRTGDVVEIKGQFLHSVSGRIVGRLAATSDSAPSQVAAPAGDGSNAMRVPVTY